MEEDTLQKQEIVSKTQLQYVYDYVGSSGDHNTREFVNQLLTTGELNIKQDYYIPQGSVEKLKKIAEAINGNVNFE